MVLACSEKEEPPDKRSGKPQKWGGRIRGVRVREFWPHWIWGAWLTRALPSNIPAPMCSDTVSFCPCYWISCYLRKKANLNLAASLYNRSVWPPFEATHTVWIVKENLFMSFHICILFIVEVFQQLLLFALSRILKTAWKHSAFCREKTPSYHTVTPTISKECNGCVPKGEKSRVCQAKYRLTAHYEGFPKTAMWSWMYGRGWYGKMRKRNMCFNLERGKKQDGPKGFP